MPALPIASLLRHHGQRKADDAVAVAMGRVGDRKSITWRELERRANQRAALLRAAGVRRDDFVTIALSNRLEFYETSFAIWKAGATPNVVPAHLPAPELRAIADIVKPRVIVSEGDFSLPGWTVLPVDASLQGFPEEPGKEPLATYYKAMSSGGSTGRPKIIVDHTPAAWDPEYVTLMMPRDGVILNGGPLYHNAPFSISHRALFIGARVSSLVRFDAEEALKVIEADRVEWMLLVPTMMNRVMRLAEAVRRSYDVSSIRTVWHGASAIAPGVKRQWIDWLGPERIFELYTATEALGSTMITGPEWLARPGSVGRAYGGSKLKIVREDGQVAVAGEVGEIYFGRGGYRPGSVLRTDEKNTSYHYLGPVSRAKTDAEGWESVGDIGWLDEDGYLFLADRRVDLIIRGGANIYPAEVEGVLESHPAVTCAVVIGLPDDDLGQRVHALVELSPAKTATASELHDFASERLARYKLPESFEFVSGRLRDDASKVRRIALREERLEKLRTGAWRPDRIARRTRPAPVNGEGEG